MDVSSGVVDALSAQATESFRTRFGKYGRPRSATRFPSQSGKPQAAACSTGSGSVTIPDQVVGADGGISVPFAGRVPVAGRSTVDVQHEIEQRLAQKAIEPQVIVTITKSVTYAATVSGEVVAGARVPLSLNGDRLLGLPSPEPPNLQSTARTVEAGMKIRLE